MSAAATLAAVSGVVAYGLFAVQSVVLTVIDVRTHRLPDRWVLPGYAVAGVLLSVAALAAREPARLLTVVGGALGLFAFYLLLRMLRPGAMGGGDVKLAGVVGAYLGYFGVETILAGALAGFVLGGIGGVVLLLSRRARVGTAIAFGPWMLAGAWFAIALAVAARTAA